MSLNGITSSALTALHTNTAALRVVSQNIANLNTPNYARREVNMAVLGANGNPAGVTIDDVTRATDQYLTQETLSASALANQYDALNAAYDQINAMLGSPGDGNSLTSSLSNVFTKLGAAQLSTNTTSSQSSVVNAMQSLASQINSMSNSLDGMSTQADQQLATAVSEANTLIKQVYDYNKLISQANLQGASDTVYLDQRDAAISSLSELMDLRISQQSDGTMLVSTQDGTSLVSSSYATLSYTPGQNGIYGTIKVQDTNGVTGNPIGSQQILDNHVSSGKIRGLIDMRDTTIAGVKNELGSFAKGVANAFNEVHNASSAYPPPTTMTGRNTGLLSSDSLNFSGQTRIALTNSSGVSQHSVDIDFTAGTISVDGGAATSFTATVGGFATALNTAMSSVGGSASFSSGVLSLSGGSSGLVIGDGPATTSSAARGGTGFSQFFGLNDLFSTSTPTISNTGMSASDALGLSANGSMKFQLKNAAGSVAADITVNLTTGMTVGQAITAMNTALGGYASVTLDPTTGAISTSVATQYAGYNLQVTDDSTLRGTTGLSVSSMFGIGSNALGKIASGFTLDSAIAASPSNIAFTQPDLTSTQVVASGDNRGLMAMQALSTKAMSFSSAGRMGSVSMSLQNYASAFYQDIATQSADAAATQTTARDRLTEAQTRMSNYSGVSLDEELSNMIIYQQAYSAGARMLTTVNALYDALFSIQ